MRILITCLLFWSASAARAQEITGTWHGLLKIMGTSLPLDLHVNDEAGGLTATFDSPSQGAFDIGIDSVSLDGTSFYWQCKAIGASYQGVFHGDSIAGTFHQAGMELPMVFLRNAPEKPVRPQDPVEPYGYEVRSVEFRNEADSVTLAGTLTLPEGEGVFPAVVLVSGSGPQNRDEELMGHRPFLVLADHLTRNGIAVLRYDDRGVGASTGNFGAATTMDLSEDARAGVKLLASMPEVDPDRIGVVGHSEGGVITAIIAARPDEVDFVVSLAGTGVIGKEVLMHQSRIIAEAQGEDEEEIEASQEFMEKMISMVNSGVSEKKIDQYLAKIYKGLSEDAKVSSGSEEVFVASMKGQFGSDWMRMFLELNPCDYWKEAKVPVLALFGSKDLQVDPKQNKEPMKACIGVSEASEMEIHVFEGLNHLFQTAQTGSPTEYAEIQETMAPVVLETVAEFILGL